MQELTKPAGEHATGSPKEHQEENGRDRCVPLRRLVNTGEEQEASCKHSGASQGSQRLRPEGCTKEGPLRWKLLTIPRISSQAA